MVSINAASSSSSRTRSGRSSVVGTCRILILVAGCIAVVKIAQNGRDLGNMMESVNYNVISSSSFSNNIRPLRQDYGDTCRLYLAESAIPNGGLGVFTAVGILPDQKVGLDDICLMVEHLPSPRESHLPTHTWGSANVFGQFETSRKKGRTKAACEGLGTLYNAAPPHLATTHKVSPHHHDNGGLHRATHPGAGAISHYYGMTGTAEDVILAGSELTVNYGDWPFDDREPYKKPKRDVEWLHENGMCVDNIEVQTATDPQMGRGAFVTRNLPKGSLVVPAPLEITRSRKDAIKYDPVSEVEPLFVNYNYYVGDMLFFPYGPGVNLINHSAEKANVKLQWSKSKFHHAEWLELSQDELWKQSRPGGLILEVVALRDLVKGEELFMDYGKDWQEAWNKHVQEWKPVEGASDYVYPAEMDETLPLRTVKEQESDPYPSNLMTVCNTPDEYRKKSNVVEWYERDDDRYEFPFRMVRCHILERKEDKHGDLYYHVQLDWKNIDYDPNVPKEKRYIDLYVPRRAIRFVDKPDMSDQHLLNGFRHPIELPKELVPTQWTTKQSS